MKHSEVYICIELEKSLQFLKFSDWISRKIMTFCVVLNDYEFTYLKQKLLYFLKAHIK